MNTDGHEHGHTSYVPYGLTVRGEMLHVQPGSRTVSTALRKHIKQYGAHRSGKNEWGCMRTLNHTTRNTVAAFAKLRQGAQGMETVGQAQNAHTTRVTRNTTHRPVP